MEIEREEATALLKPHQTLVLVERKLIVEGVPKYDDREHLISEINRIIDDLFRVPMVAVFGTFKSEVNELGVGWVKD